MTSTAARARSPYPSRTASRPAVLPRVDPVIWGDRTAPGPLDAASLEHYDTNGFVSLDALLTDHEVESLPAEIDRVVASLAPDDERLVIEPESNQVRSVFAIHELSPTFSALLTDPRLVERARQVLGDDVYIHQSRVNRKPGFHGKEFSWHSDFETWHIEDGMPRMRALSVSIALSENRIDNGSLMILRGSHRHFVSCVGETPEDHYRASLRSQEIGVPDEGSIGELARAGGIATCLGPAGSATMFDANCMHGSNGNITPYGRSNVFVVYNAVSNALTDPFGGLAPRPEFLATRRPVGT